MAWLTNGNDKRTNCIRVEVHQMQGLGSPVRRIPCLPLDNLVRLMGKQTVEMHQTGTHQREGDQRKRSIDYIKNVSYPRHPTGRNNQVGISSHPVPRSLSAATHPSHILRDSELRISQTSPMLWLLPRDLRYCPCIQSILMIELPARV